MPSAWPMAAKKHKPIPQAEGRGGIPGPDCQKSPSRTTCAYGWDTYREICRRECARPQGRVRGSAANFVPRGKHTEARPADDAARCAWLRSRGAACGRNSRGGAGAAVQIFKRTASGAENLGNGNPGQCSNFYKGILCPQKKLVKHKRTAACLLRGRGTA